jgi:diguanylate cyclase (GGDEF)-like protein/PAS domain S-box-containing protein
MHETTPAPILAVILDTADEGFVAFDRSGKCVLAGRRLGELFGVELGALLGGPEGDVLKLLASACEEPDTLLQLAKTAAGPAEQVAELELNRPRLRTVRFETTPIPDERGANGWLGIVRDVTRERSAERRSHQLLQRLEQITATDALTQLPNRRRFIEELDREHGRAARAWDSYAILRVDIDGLKLHNEELGVPRGDEILEKVAERLRDGRREYDVLARFQEDEFIVLLPGADMTAARVVAERMRNAVSNAPIGAAEVRKVSVSVGAAVWVPPSGETGPDVVRRAGDALAAAQRRGLSEITIEGEASPAPPAVAKT